MLLTAPGQVGSRPQLHVGSLEVLLLLSMSPSLPNVPPRTSSVFPAVRTYRAQESFDEPELHEHALLWEAAKIKHSCCFFLFCLNILMRMSLPYRATTAMGLLGGGYAIILHLKH